MNDTINVMGREAVYFDRHIIDMMKRGTMVWWRMSRNYRSIWRVLHIDGLEGNPYRYKHLPLSEGRIRTFFQYKVEAV